MPFASAWRIKKLNGRKVPKEKKNMARTSNRNGASLNGLTMGARGGNRGLDMASCMRLDLTVRLVKIKRPKIKNATVRIVHAKPILGISRSTMIGKMIPPTDAPDEMIPNAVERRLTNHVLTELEQELKMALTPMALQTDCARKNW